MATKKKPVGDTESCASCKFHLPNKDDEYGFCRRYPPAALIDGEETVVLWPITDIKEWCGEYSRKLNS